MEKLTMKLKRIRLHRHDYFHFLSYNSDAEYPEKPGSPKIAGVVIEVDEALAETEVGFDYETCGYLELVNKINSRLKIAEATPEKLRAAAEKYVSEENEK
jgi:hypothetical protein